MARVDPITLDVVEGGLEAAIEEAEAAVERTARSTIIREQHDYRASLNNLRLRQRHARLLGERPPTRSGRTSRSTRSTRATSSSTTTSTTPTARSRHLPDYCVVVPVFADGRDRRLRPDLRSHATTSAAACWGAGRSHRDSIFEEAIQIPPVKLYDERSARRGHLQGGPAQQPLPGRPARRHRRVRRCGADHRAAHQRAVRAARHGPVEAGDVQAHRACARDGPRRHPAAVPDGEYVGEDFVDNDGINLDEPVKLKVALRKDPEKMIARLERVEPADRRVRSTGRSDGRMLSKWIGAFLKQVSPGMVINEGVTEVLRSYLPPGTIFAPQYPAGVANRMQPMLRCFGAYGVCLAQAFNGEVVADMHCIQLYGFFGEDADGVALHLPRGVRRRIGRASVCRRNGRRRPGAELEEHPVGVHGAALSAHRRARRPAGRLRRRRARTAAGWVTSRRSRCLSTGTS